MPWHQYSPALGMTPMNRSRLGLGAIGDPTEQYANDPYPSMQSSVMPTNPFSPFPMSSMLPLNKFSGYGMGSPWGGGMMNPWVQNPWANYQPTQWAGPNAFYPNWTDPPAPMLPEPDQRLVPMAPPPEQRGGEADEFQAQLRTNAENFYRNNPDHPLSRFDAAVRNVLGVRQLDSPGQLAGKPQTVPQGYTPQTQPNLAQQAQAARAKERQEKEAKRQRTARTRSMGTRARGGRDSSGTSGPTGGMGGQGWT